MKIKLKKALAGHDPETCRYNGNGFSVKVGESVEVDISAEEAKRLEEDFPGCFEIGGGYSDRAMRPKARKKGKSDAK